jgi:hypothetical protein
MYTALYAEAVFQDRGERRFSLSTTVHISGGLQAGDRTTRYQPERRGDP